MGTKFIVEPEDRDNRLPVGEQQHHLHPRFCEIQTADQNFESNKNLKPNLTMLSSSNVKQDGVVEALLSNI